MTLAVARQHPWIVTGAVRNIAVDFQDQLDDGELLTGTPTVEQVGTSDLTLSDEAVNTAALNILGRAVAIGQAAQFSVSGAAAGVTYTLRVTCGTDASPAQTLVVVLTIPCEDDK